MLFLAPEELPYTPSCNFRIWIQTNTYHELHFPTRGSQLRKHTQNNSAYEGCAGFESRLRQRLLQGCSFFSVLHSDAEMLLYLKIYGDHHVLFLPFPLHNSQTSLGRHILSSRQSVSSSHFMKLGGLAAADRQWRLSWARQIHSSASPSAALRFTLILTTNMHSGLWRDVIRLKRFINFSYPHAFYTPRQSHLAWSDLHCNIWWGVQITKFFVT